MPRNTTKINENELPRYLDPSKKAAVEMRDIIINALRNHKGLKASKARGNFHPTIEILVPRKNGRDFTQFEIQIR
jgi:hypothetical protein